MEKDLGERNNLADQYPERVKELKAELDTHVEEIKQDVRPPAFVENPKPLLSNSAGMPTLVKYRKNKKIKSIS